MKFSRKSLFLVTVLTLAGVAALSGVVPAIAVHAQDGSLDVGKILDYLVGSKSLSSLATVSQWDKRIVVVPNYDAQAEMEYPDLFIPVRMSGEPSASNPEYYGILVEASAEEKATPTMWPSDPLADPEKHVVIDGDYPFYEEISLSNLALVLSLQAASETYAGIYALFSGQSPQGDPIEGYQYNASAGVLVGVQNVQGDYDADRNALPDALFPDSWSDDEAVLGPGRSWASSNEERSVIAADLNFPGDANAMAPEQPSQTGRFRLGEDITVDLPTQRALGYDPDSMFTLGVVQIAGAFANLFDEMDVASALDRAPGELLDDDVPVVGVSVRTRSGYQGADEKIDLEEWAERDLEIPASVRIAKDVVLPEGDERTAGLWNYPISLELGEYSDSQFRYGFFLPQEVAKWMPVSLDGFESDELSLTGAIVPMLVATAINLETATFMYESTLIAQIPANESIPLTLSGVSIPVWMADDVNLGLAAEEADDVYDIFIGDSLTDGDPGAPLAFVDIDGVAVTALDKENPAPRNEAHVWSPVSTTKGQGGKATVTWDIWVKDKLNDTPIVKTSKEVVVSETYAVALVPSPVDTPIELFNLDPLSGAPFLAEGRFFSGDTVTAEVGTDRPGEGWYFVQWLDGASITSREHTFTVAGDRNITVEFRGHSFTDISGVGGRIDASAPTRGIGYAHGDTVTLTAVADDGYSFVPNSWVGYNPESLVGLSENELTLVFNEDTTVGAEFLQAGKWQLLLLPVDNGRIEVSPESANFQYDENQVVTLTAVPDANYAFIGWTDDADGLTNNPLLLTMDYHKTIGAVFASQALSVGPENRYVSGQAGNATFDVEASGAWTASTGADWLTLDPVSGTGNAVLTASFGKNDTGLLREATITVTAGESSVDVMLTQASTVSISSDASDALVGIGATVPILLHFSPAVAMVEPPARLLLNAADEAFAEHIPDSKSNTSVLRFNYVVAEGDSANVALDVVSLVNGASIVDPAGNFDPVDTTLPAAGQAGSLSASKSIVVDGVRPVITVVPDPEHVESVDVNGVPTDFLVVDCASDWNVVGPAVTVTDNRDQDLAYAEQVRLLDANFDVVVDDEGAEVEGDIETFMFTSGDYRVQYDATDNAGNAAEPVIQYVRVRDNCPSLVVTPATVDVLATAGSVTFNVFTRFAWSVASDDAWVTSVVPNGGNGDGTFAVFYQANPVNMARSATLTVTSGDDTVAVTINQAAGAAAALSVSPASRAVAAGAGSTTFSITTTGAWTATSNVGWATVGNASGNGNATLTVDYTANTDASVRTATITVTGTGTAPATFAVSVVQSGVAPLPGLVVTPANRSVSADAGNVTFDIATTQAWTADSDADWATLSDDTGAGNATLTVDYTANDSEQARTATITVTGTGTAPESVQVTVTQAAAVVTLAVTPANRAVSANAGAVVFSIATDQAWTADSDATWTSVSDDSGAGNADITVAYEANTSDSERVARITVSGAGTVPASVVVTITQAASDADEVTLTIAIDPEEGGSVKWVSEDGEGVLENGGTLTVVQGTTVALEAVPTEGSFFSRGYRFMGWEGLDDSLIPQGCRGNSPEKTTVTLEQDMTVTAVFKGKMPAWQITVIALGVVGAIVAVVAS